MGTGTPRPPFFRVSLTGSQPVAILLQALNQGQDAQCHSTRSPPFQPILPVIPSEIEMNDVDQPMNSLSLSFEEALYANYLRDPDSVSPDWRQYFDELSHGDHPASKATPTVTAMDDRANGNGNGNGHKLRLGPKFRPGSFFAPRRRRRGSGDQSTAVASRPAPPPQQLRSPCPPAAAPTALRHSTADRPGRRSGHSARSRRSVDPRVSRSRAPGRAISIRWAGRGPNCRSSIPRTYHFTEADMDRSFSTDTIEGPQVMTLRRIIERLRNTYCRSIGVQFMHMDDLNVRQWLQVRMEGSENRLHAQPPRAISNSDASDATRPCSRNSSKSDSWARKAFRWKGPKR